MGVRLVKLPPRTDLLVQLARASPGLSGAVALFVLLVLVYCTSIDIRASRGASITGDEPFYLITTQSLLSLGRHWPP